MIIKVCGMREPGNIRELEKLMPDYMGFIFYAPSRRFVGDLDPSLTAGLSPAIKKTGVFVDEAMDVIADLVMKYNLDAVQLHGSESVEFCRSLGKFLLNMQTEKPVELIKAFGISDDFDFTGLSAYEDVVDHFLFDTKTPAHGGSGSVFNWSILKNYNGKKSYFLSGGLSSENIAGISDLKDGRLYGLDLNSKFEVEAGVKDIQQLKALFELVKN